ncbi:MAG: hypothetical protein B7Y45_02650 [Sphingomonas sp. 28-66-16]|nr:MAG: hypothetical protein B7Y45_02650 [Sphingomonas sp. 28-66-16]
MGLAVVALIAAGIVYLASERIIRADHVIAARPIAVPHDDASVAEGARLATLVGCPSCHNGGKGGVWTPVDWKIGQIAPPAIARKLAAYSDVDVVRLIRHGVKRDGSTLFVMPSWSERYLADDDLGRVIAWARTLKPAADDSRAEGWWGPQTRWGMITGAERQSVQKALVAPHTRPADGGAYLVRAVCSECHALHREQGKEGQRVPALAPAAASYDDAAFATLLRTGKGAGNRDLGLMTTIVKENLHVLRDDEVTAIHRFLQREAARQGA